MLKILLLRNVHSLNVLNVKINETKNLHAFLRIIIVPVFICKLFVDPDNFHAISLSIHTQEFDVQKALQNI